MDIEEIRRQRTLVESEISAAIAPLLRKFTEETQMALTGVDVSLIDATAYQDRFRTYEASVSIRIEI